MINIFNTFKIMQFLDSSPMKFVHLKCERFRIISLPSNDVKN